MFTWGSKFLFALSAVGILGAVVFGLVTGGDPLGVISAGYKGGVGNHFGYAMFLFAAATSFTLGCVAVISRDGDAEAMADLVGVETAPAVTPPADPAPWGILTAFGIASLIVGLAGSTAFFYLGFAILFVAGAQWLVQAWSDRASGDPEVNRVIRNRTIGPFEVPLLGTLGIAVVVIGMSRIFLAVPSGTWSVIAGTIATVLVFGGAVILSKVEVKRSVMSGIIALGAVAVIAGGIVGSAVGERDFHHGEEHTEEAE